MMKKIIYLKAKPKKTFVFPVRTISLSLMAAGFLLIILALWPILSFDFITVPKFSFLAQPVPDTEDKRYIAKQGFQVGTNNEDVNKKQDSEVKAQEIESEIAVSDDYTKASVWFPKKPAVRLIQQESKDYSLSIPKLKITNAHVEIGGDDLGKSLIHYGGTAYPGEYGNTVIFGHSTLPYFYNPNDYKSIFSWLPSLNEEDEIFVNYEGVTYKYVISEMRVVSPEDVSILEQTFDDSYLSLITCVPPGTYNHRLWVKARIKKI